MTVSGTRSERQRVPTGSGQEPEDHGTPDGSRLAAVCWSLADRGGADGRGGRPCFGGDAQAQRLIQIGAAKRTATVTVYIGKSEDVRTDTSFVEHHRRRSRGGRRQSADRPLALDPRQEERHHARVGLRRRQEADRRVRRRGGLRHLAAADRDQPPLPARQPEGLGGQRPHHAVGHGAGRPDRRQGGADRQAVRRRTSSTRCRCSQPQQVMLEVRFVEATRAGRPRTRRAVERVRPAAISPTSAIARRRRSFR